MRFAAFALAIGSFIPAPEQRACASVPPQSCSDPGAPTSRSLDDLNRQFAQQAIEIVRAAHQLDRRRLATLVAPVARFTVWNGDIGLGRERGVEGAIEFAQNIHASNFRYLLPFAGPLAGDPCGVQTAQISFSNPYENVSFIVDFRFERGLLLEAVGREGMEVQGEIRSGSGQVERRGLER